MRTEDVHPRVTLIKSSNPHLAGGEQRLLGGSTPWKLLDNQFWIIYANIPYASFTIQRINSITAPR